MEGVCMNETNSIPSLETGGSQPSPWREILTDAIRYRERHRIAYNAVLAIVVISWIVFSWPHFRPAFTWPSLAALLVLAVFANVCYCAAYFTDVAMQLSSFRDKWRRRRWVLWLSGTLFAILLTNYWIADEIYSFVH
jgi:amino acid transporter